MKTAFVQHDGLSRPEARIAAYQMRGLPSGDWEPRWTWAGMTHRPEDVLSYHVALEDQPVTLRGKVLDAAREAVLRDRAATHGAVENSFGDLARVWSVRLGVEVSAAQVALMLVDLKVTRAWGNPGHFDNWVDIAGYGACGAEVAGGGP